MMNMTFYWVRQVTILFDSWKTDSWHSYFLSLLASFLISIFYQYMEDLRLRFKLRSKNLPQPPSRPLCYYRRSATVESSPPRNLLERSSLGSTRQFGYMLMLAVMSFNASVFAAVVVGLGVGYLVFRMAVRMWWWLIILAPMRD